MRTGDGLRDFGQWLCRNSLICQYFNPPRRAAAPAGEFCPTMYRKSGGGGGRFGSGGRSGAGNPPMPPNDGNCKREWAQARSDCADQMADGTIRPSDFDRCVRGNVSYRCGGNRPDYSKSPGQNPPKGKDEEF
jgi:hypothetical protein